MKSVAVMGLGAMGAGMAHRLMGAGFSLIVYNRTQSRAESMKAGGAVVAATPRDAAERADVVISMVADDAASRSVWMEEDGALNGVRPGTVLIESSTLSLSWVMELSAKAESQGCHFLDAPVTGSKPHAENGELLFLVGGSGDALEGVKNVLVPMSRRVVHMGPVGSGTLMKLINNFLCGMQVASLAEAFALIERSGLDRSKAVEVLSGGAPGSPLLQAVITRMAARDYRRNFALHLMAKDLTYAIAEAERLGVNLQTGRAGLELFRQAAAIGWKEDDFSAVVEIFRAAQDRE